MPNVSLLVTLSPLVTIHLFSMFVSLFLFCVEHQLFKDSVHVIVVKADALGRCAWSRYSNLYETEETAAKRFFTQSLSDSHKYVPG